MMEERFRGGISNLNVDGYFLAWEKTQPYVIRLENSDDWFLPIFSTVEKLKAHMAYIQQKLGPTPYTIKKIDSGLEFFKSVHGQARVMVDPEIVSEHHTRWKEMVWKDDLPTFVEKYAGK